MSVVANVAINVDAANAIKQLQQVDAASKDIKGGLDTAGAGAKGFGAALQSAMGPLLAFTTAIAVVQKSISTAFERGAAEQRLKNLTSSTQEYQAALSIAARSASKFGMSQTDTTKALADVYSRLKGVGFGLNETAQIYEGFNVIAKQSGLTAEEASGAFFQLSQALGKGKLNGDEFVIVAERMPQLLDAIAAATGKSRGELQGMAQDGKITSQVLYQALAQSASAAGDLNAKLTEQQRAMNALGQVSDKLLYSLGQVFGPIVVKGAELLAWAGQKLAEWWDYLGGVVFPKVYEAVKPLITEMQKIWSAIPWDTIIGYIQGALIKALNGAIEALKFMSPILAGIIGKFMELAQNPVFKFIAEQVGRLANFLGLSSTAVTDYKAKQDAAKESAAGLVKNFSSLPPQIDSAEKKAKELKIAQDAVTKSIKESSKAIDERLSRETAGIDRVLKVSDARLQAEMAINNVKLSQAERDLQSAKTDDQRIAAAKQVLVYTIEQARLQRDLTLLQIESEVQKAKAAARAAQLKEKEIELAVKLAIINKTITNEHYELLGIARLATNEAIQQLNAASGAAYYQRQAANATFEGAKRGAQAAYQSNILSKSTGAAASNTSKIASNMERTANSAEKAANSIGAINVKGFSGLEPWMEAKIAQAKQGAIMGSTGSSFASYAAGVNAELAMRAKFEQILKAKAPTGFSQQETDFWAEASALGFGKFASGGYVTTPTLGLIGEGGEPEYIIPQSKMATAASNYLSGGRGAGIMEGGDGDGAVINIQTGPVVEMNGERYVSMADLERAMRKTADSVYASLRTPSSRIALGRS